jgi:hypothetical protein
MSHADTRIPLLVRGPDLVHLTRAGHAQAHGLRSVLPVHLSSTVYSRVQQ